MNRSAEAFRKGVLARVDAKEGYEYGKESRIGTDCSGLPSGALIEMGYKIRTDANELYHKIFTIPVLEHDELDLDRIMAVFYVMQKAWKKLDGTKMPPDTARHVSPVVGRYVVADADWERDKVLLKTAKEVRLELEKVGARAVWREIDWDAACRYSGILYYNPDPELTGSINNTD
ncbi:hypothetical protein LCGC14_1196850 [marine sediment metagenome]|uniref:Uncharacterized protein n=1 Tax=marine sediment metagenome TaxID=412755 RepID=A0A0F9M5E6_9ZZZZ